MNLGICILHYNTPKLLDDLLKMVPEAMVVDNASNPPLNFPIEIGMLENFGFTGGWNAAIGILTDKGARNIRYDALWLMNSDIVISRACIDRMKQVLVDPDVNIISPSFNCWMNTGRNQNSGGLREVKVIEFTAPIIKTAVFEKIGLFDERFAKGWGVEFDFCHRAREAGYKIHVDDCSNFYHIGQQTIGTLPGGYNGYGPAAQKELDKGMEQLYGRNWQHQLYGDPDFIKHLAE